MKNNKIKKAVKERYSQIAKKDSSCCPTCSPYGSDVIEQAKRIGYSEKELENLKTLVPDGMITKTFHPIYKIFRRNRWTREKARDALNVSGNIILFFGFVRPYKGLKYLIDAIPEVLQKIEVTLLIVGEFWKDRRQYLKQIKNMKIEDRIKIVNKYISNEEVYFSRAIC